MRLAHGVPAAERHGRGEEVRLAPGQTFYEAPGDVHVVGRNASATERAKFLAFFVKDAGAPILKPAQ